MNLSGLRKAKSMTRNLLLIGAFLICLQGMGATYHVSPNGNDNNSGTSPAQAWRTIQRADQVSFQAGDQLLLERGGVYRGTLNIYQNELHLLRSDYARWVATVREWIAPLGPEEREAILGGNATRIYGLTKP